MDEGNFDLKQWVREVDTSRVDESLDEDAKGLFVLNDALLNPHSGPTLAALIVKGEPGCGLDSLIELGDCSEPRLAMMAVVNILNVLTGECQSENEDTISDATTSPGTEPQASIQTDNPPSEVLVRTKIAKVSAEMSKLFVAKATAGDLCPDFLTFLVTGLMKLFLQSNADEIPEVTQSLALIPTKQFLKTVLRVWKSPELHQHLSQSEDDDPFNLGFLVTFYLKSICSVKTDRGGVDSAMDSETMAPQRTGIDALIELNDWAVKFFLMRLYSPAATAIERAQLISVLNTCANRSATFTDSLLRECILTAVARISAHGDSDFPSQGVLSAEETMLCMSNTVPWIVMLIHLSNHLLQDVVVPGSGIWFEGKQSRVTMSLAKAMTPMISRGLNLVILSDFPSSDEGRAQNLAVVSLVSHLIAQVWKAGIAVLFREYSQAQDPLRRAFLHLFEELASSVQDLCGQRNLEWEEVSRLHRISTLKIGVAACSALVRNAKAWEEYSKTGDAGNCCFVGCLRTDVCEWCLRSGNILMLCSKCKKVSYCSIEHQRAHWIHGHRTECRLLRNCLEGSSFSRRVDGRLRGLVGEEEGESIDANTDVPFGEFVVGQRKELLVLGYRMPGVMVERRRIDGRSEVFYKTRLGALKTIARRSDAESFVANLLIAEALLVARRDTSSMLYLWTVADNPEVGTLSLYSVAEESAHSLSVQLFSESP